MLWWILLLYIAVVFVVAIAPVVAIRVGCFWSVVFAFVVAFVSVFVVIAVVVVALVVVALPCSAGQSVIVI